MRAFLTPLLLLAAGCAGASPAAPPAPQEAMRAALAADSQAGQRRNHASENGPIAAGVRSYVAQLDALDLRGCPEGFVGALRAHRDAWAAMIPLLEEFADERGELHAVFERIEARGGASAERFGALRAALTTTWEDVERERDAYDG